MNDKEQRLYDALKRIASYESPAWLRKNAWKQYGLPSNEAIEGSYENIIDEARAAISGMRRPKGKHGKDWAKCGKCINTAYCGCCGRPCGSGYWCRDCSKHVLKSGRVEERTYFAQFSEDCPHQVPATAEGERAE